MGKGWWGNVSILEPAFPRRARIVGTLLILVPRLIEVDVEMLDAGNLSFSIYRFYLRVNRASESYVLEYNIYVQFLFRFAENSCMIFRTFFVLILIVINVICLIIILLLLDE